MKIDKKDLQIVGILDWNARMPFTQIAKKAKLNKDVVKYRIFNLEKKGIIQGYYVVVDTSKLGYLSIRIYFDFVGLDNIKKQKIIKYLADKFDASQVFEVDGEYEIGILVWEKSIYALSEKLNDFKNVFGNYINKLNLSIITSIDHYSRKYLGDNVNLISFDETQKVEFKESDLSILSELSKDARITSTELSTKLNIPQTTIVHRIRDLEKKKIILGYRANINISKLGYENYYLELYTKNKFEIEKIVNFVKSNLNCVYSLKVIPGADLELEMEFENKDDLFEFIRLLKEKFKTIRKIKYWSTIKYHKINYFPFVRN